MGSPRTIREFREALRLAGTEIRDYQAIIALRNAEIAELKDKAWAGEVNADESMEMLGEAEEMIAKLLAVIADPTLYEHVRAVQSAEAHHKHIRSCRKGACDDLYHHIGPARRSVKPSAPASDPAQPGSPRNAR